MYNGNGRKSINLLHWNMGSRRWFRKTDDVRQVLVDYSPDIFIVSEANLYIETTPEQSAIEGYFMIQPLTMESRKHSRLLVLVKDGFQIKIRNDLMDQDTLSIWMEVQRKGGGKLLIAAIYREHSILRLPTPNNSGDITQQTTRWSKTLKQIKTASRNNDTFIIGDINLDFSRWNNPAQGQKKMVDETKMELEAEGFQQIVRGITRSWRGQQDSSIVHIWTNVPVIVISTLNKIKAPSDHHIIGATIRIKGLEGNNQEFYCRDRKQFNLERFCERLRSSRWEELYDITDLDRANNWFKQTLRNAIQEECPLKIVQPNKKLKNWIKSETKNKFLERDIARTNAKQSDTEEDWSKYKALRNKATNMSRENKKSHFKQLYNDMESQNNIRGLYRTVKTQLGWKTTGPPQSLDIGSRKLTAPRDISNAQLSYFKEKIEKLMTTIP